MSTTEAQKAANRAWREANPERVREYRRVWRLANPEKQRDSEKVWRAANPERSREIKAAWAKRNRPILRERDARRRARKRGATVFEAFTRAEIIARDKSICHICGKRVPKDQIHIDHLVPLALGGEHTAANVAVAHAACNTRKGTKGANDQLRLVG